MNYAEDRLDRRAQAEDSGALVVGEIKADLEKAHVVFTNVHHSVAAKGISTAGDNNIDNTLQLIDAHELTGRTLRDCGKIRQSVFHFGMAWKLAHKIGIENEWKAVGDYAQICEIAGFPEVGILALLYFRCRGSLDPNIALDDDSQQANSLQTSCGCGFHMCGASPCFIAFPSESLLLLEIYDAIEDLDKTETTATGEAPLRAHDILGQLAQISRSKSPLKLQFQKMHSYLTNNMEIKARPVLQFWDNQLNETAFHQLPTVNMLLLLKLLFSCPCGGSLVKLACMAIPYLSILLPPTSKEGKRMAREYKSHNAYFVFIRALVLGERIKKHRLGKVIHHNPVWDTVFGDGSEKDVGFVRHNRTTLSIHFKKVIHNSSSNTKSSISRQITSHPPIYVVGDSHVLSLAWQILHINDTNSNTLTLRKAAPFPTTGVKAYHLRTSTQFFTHYNLHACIQRLPNQDTTRKRTIILSAGEIDCREGIGGTLLKGYYRSCDDAVAGTVHQYLRAASEIASKYNLQILIMPVAPHAYRSEKNGKSVGRAKRRVTMCLWNEMLRKELPSKCKNLFLLDYEGSLQYPDKSSPVGYVLNPCFNADYTHTNNAIVPLVAKAIQNSGCDLSCL